ncbi:MAG: SPFH domain-containing protein [Candidatus Hydrogenedentota bacterium]
MAAIAGMGWVVIGGAILAVAVVGYMLVYLAFLKKAGPNEVIVVSGRGQVKFITGGADMVIPLFHTWNSLSLEVMTLDVTTPEVYTAQGVPIAVDAVAQIKIKKDIDSLHAAAERFLGKSPAEIAKIALETVQGHLRAILGTMTVENIYQKRDEFASNVMNISGEDLKKMGLGIDSFQIRDIRDQHGYLEALGKPQIAEVKKKAAVAEAKANMEAQIAQADSARETRERQAEAQKLAQEAEARSSASIAEASADKDRRQKEAEAMSRRKAEIANFQAMQAIAEEQRQANLKKAEADMAYELQKKTQEIQVQVQEIKRKELELDATVKRTADAKRYEIETLAEAERKKVEIEAAAERNRLTTVAEGEKARGFAAAEVTQAQGQAQAEADKAKGLAEAQIRQAQGMAEGEARKAQGLAEALAMEKKAEAWQKYGEAAILQILAPIMPEIARAIAEPLSRIDKITMVNTGGSDVGPSRITSEVAKMIAQVPPVIESLTGLKVGEMLQKYQPPVTQETKAEPGAKA